MGDSPCPAELLTKGYIGAFGVEAVMCRPFLYAYEIHRMIAEENIVNAYKSRKHHRDKDGNENWVEWQQQNPELARILRTAEMVEDG